MHIIYNISHRLFPYLDKNDLATLSHVSWKLRVMCEAFCNVNHKAQIAYTCYNFQQLCCNNSIHKISFEVFIAYYIKHKVNIVQDLKLKYQTGSVLKDYDCITKLKNLREHLERAIKNTQLPKWIVEDNNNYGLKESNGKIFHKYLYYTLHYVCTHKFPGIFIDKLFKKITKRYYAWCDVMGIREPYSMWEIRHIRYYYGHLNSVNPD